MANSEVAPGRGAFLRGIASTASIPALILTAVSAGFGVFGRETGLSLAHTLFIIATLWAMPSQVVLVGSMLSGGSLLATAVAVALTSIRFAPMTASWAPYFRRDITPRWKVLLLSHLVVVTAWVFAATRLPDMDPRERYPFFAGFALTLYMYGLSACALAYLLAGAMPPVAAGALFFLTPIYFLCGMTAASRLPVEKIALGGGLFVGPLFHWLGLPLDLLWTGFATGTAAYLVTRIMRRRA